MACGCGSAQAANATHDAAVARAGAVPSTTVYYVDDPDGATERFQDLADARAHRRETGGYIRAVRAR